MSLQGSYSRAAGGAWGPLADLYRGLAAPSLLAAMLAIAMSSRRMNTCKAMMTQGHDDTGPCPLRHRIMMSMGGGHGAIMTRIIPGWGYSQERSQRGEGPGRGMGDSPGRVEAPPRADRSTHPVMGLGTPSLPPAMLTVRRGHGEGPGPWHGRGRAWGTACSPVRSRTQRRPQPGHYPSSEEGSRSSPWTPAHITRGLGS